MGLSPVIPTFLHIWAISDWPDAGVSYAYLTRIMSKPSVNSSDADRQPIAEPTKYIVLCCELRKRREVRSSSIPSRQRIRVSVEN
jgi:hypothetical protein